MRTLRLSLAGTVIFALLGGLGGLAALAQTSEEDALDPMRASQFTGSWGDDWQDTAADMQKVFKEGYFESLDNESVHLFEASDARISGTWTQVLDLRSYVIDTEVMWAPVWSGAVRIDNDGGAWVGTFHGYAGENGIREFYRLDGEGAYTGLTAVFGWVEEAGDVYDGVISPGGPPDDPEPVLAGATDAEAMEAAPTAEALAEETGAGVTDDEGSDTAGAEVGTRVTGTIKGAVSGEITIQEDDSVALHQYPGTCYAKLSDPRVSGGCRCADCQQARFKLPGEPWLDYGMLELLGPDGTWVGPRYFINDAALEAFPGWAVLEGTGDYDGWTFVFYSPNALDPQAELSGILYEGPPPPWRATLPLAPAE